LLLVLLSTAAVEAQAPVVRATPADLSQRLARVEQQLQNQGLLNMLQQLESIQTQLNQLQGEMEVMKRDIEELSKRQRAMYSDLDQRLQGTQPTTTTNLTATAEPGTNSSPPLQTLSPAYDTNAELRAPATDNALNIQMLPSTPAGQTAPTNNAAPAANPNSATVIMPAPAVQTVATTAPTMTPSTGAETGISVAQPAADPVQMQVEYDRAFNLLKLSQYEPAIQAFTAYLSKYPTGDYSDNAQYWLGEAYYVTRQFEQALLEYNKLIVNFPHSQKYTHALLKIGYCYQELGRIGEAKKYLQALTRQYPGETASRLAEERLKSIALTEQQAGTPQN